MNDLHPFLQEVPSEQEIGGASGAQRFYLLAYGKGNSEEYPYNVVNEKISSELARLVGLPVPEVLLYSHREKWLFLSRSVAGISASGEIKPPGTSRDIQRAIGGLPGIIEEMTCFDIFICNNDRNAGNFICDADKQLWLIDYGNALFYRPRHGHSILPGIPRLKSIEDDLTNLFDKPYKFLEHCHTWDAVARAYHRINAIPKYFIKNTVKRLPSGLLTDEERDFLIDFLIRRKSQMERIIKQNAKLFPNLKIPSI